MVDKIWQAIPRMEGFYASLTSRAKRNHNPGNIEWGAFAKGMGAIGIEKTPLHEIPRFAVFLNDDDGFAALKQLLSNHYSGQSVEAVMQHYAPPTDNNNTDAYVQFICTHCNCTPNTIINDLM
jgi:hypothetical protein